MYGIAFGATVDEVWVLNAGQAVRLNWKNNHVEDRIASDGTPGLQGIQFDSNSGRAYISSTQNRKVKLLAIENGRSKIVAEGIGDQIAGGVALAKNGMAIVPLIYNNTLAIVDTAQHIAQPRTRISAVTGIAPFGAAINTQGTVAYVSNWGGRLPKTGDITARTGLLPEADRVVVDSRGIASTGTSIRTGPGRASVPGASAGGLHPMAILWDEPRIGLRRQRKLRFGCGDRRLAEPEW